MRPGDVIELAVDGLAAGGAGVGRTAEGRVVFVRRTAPGDLVRARVTRVRPRLAYAELIEVVQPSAERVVPPCALAASGACGGCPWQHVELAAQRRAKQILVERALRGAVAGGLVVEPVRTPGPALGWRRRARLHVEAGVVGMRAEASHALTPVARCPQLEPALDRARAAVAAAAPPDGELALLLGHRGEVAVAVDAAWPAAAALLGTAGIASIVAGSTVHGAATVEVDPGIAARASDFAQASRPGNDALVAEVMGALGAGPGRLLELYAGAGNLTRAAVAAGWEVVASDGARPPGPHPAARFVAAPAARAVERLRGERFDAILIDPPRAGAADVMPALAGFGARRLVYVSCDPATLARDLDRVADAWHAERAVPLDLMPQTDHVEVVVTLVARDR
ncbi:MAG: TRAM domain-containing protein [Kofleriaceae bacterium]